MDRIFKGFLYAAYRDVTCVEALLNAGISAYSEAIAFHSQQAAEKELKAVLVELGIIPSKTHDLVELLDQLVKESTFNVNGDCIEAAARLSRHAVVSRYTFTFEVKEGEALEAVADCNVIAKTIGNNGFDFIEIGSSARHLDDIEISNATELANTRNKNADQFKDWENSRFDGSR